MQNIKTEILEKYLNTFLEFYFSFDYFSSLVSENSPISKIFEQFNAINEVIIPEIKSLKLATIEEIRKNLLNLNDPKEVKKYEFLILKYINDYDRQYYINDDYYKSIIVNAGLEISDTDNEVFDNLIMLREDCFRALRYVRFELLTEWTEFKTKVGKEIEFEFNSMKDFGETFSMLEKNADSIFPTKLKWMGTPSQFGYLIIELIGKGYLQKPTGSFTRDAKIYLDIFDIRGPGGPTTPGTIAKEINDQQNSLSTENGRLLKLPRIEQLK